MTEFTDHAPQDCELPDGVAFTMTGHFDGAIVFHSHADPAAVACCLRECADSLSAHIMDGTAPGSGR